MKNEGVIPSVSAAFSGRDVRHCQGDGTNWGSWSKELNAQGVTNAEILVLIMDATSLGYNPRRATIITLGLWDHHPAKRGKSSYRKSPRFSAANSAPNKSCCRWRTLC